MIAKILLPVIIIIGLTSLVPTSYELAYYGKIYPGVTINNVDLGNLTPQQAQEKLTSQINKMIPTTISLQSEDQTWELVIADLNLTANFNEAVSFAYQIGREGGVINQIREKVLAWQGKINLNLKWQFDQEKINEKVSLISQNTDRTGQPSQIFSQGTTIWFTPGQEGLVVDQRELKELIISRLNYLDSQPITVPTKAVNPIPDQEAISHLKEQAQNLVGKTIILSLEGKEFAINDADLVSFLHYNPDSIRNNIADWVTGFAAQVNQSPTNAQFRFQDGLTVTKASQPGIEVDQTRLSGLIEEGLDILSKDSEKALNYQLPAQTTPAQINADNINDLGIKEKIGQGESFFRGSSNARIHNIKTAAEKLNNYLVAPGKIFSFNQALGEISLKNGYQEGYIIKEGQTTAGIGGGVCQVSTTFFRAALNTGLPIEERQAHAYRVGVYEQESHPGLDATVYAPSPDLKFKNDTGHYLLIETVFSPTDYHLVVNIYGTGDGRQVSLANFRLWDIAPPPPALYIEDPSLPEGEIKQVDWAAYGAKASFDWEVTRNGKILQKETFYSYYQPWQAKYLKGTGENN